METKILLIDNQPELPTELAHILFDEGYHIFNILDLNDSHEIVKNNAPDVIILNNYNENHDLKIFKELKDLSSIDLKIILISNESLKDNIENFGINKLILSNGDNEYLFEEIHNFLNSNNK